MWPGESLAWPTQRTDEFAIELFVSGILVGRPEDSFATFERQISCLVGKIFRSHD